MMSYVIQRMPCEGFYPTIVLTFPCGRARMICIHYVWMRFFFKRAEQLRFRNIRLPVDRALTNDVSKTIVTVGPFPSKILCSIELYTICNELYIPYNMNCVRHRQLILARIGPRGINKKSNECHITRNVTKYHCQLQKQKCQSQSQQGKLSSVHSIV